MNQKKGRVLRSSSGACESPQKRQKLNPADSSSVPPLDPNSDRLNQICQEMSDRLEGVKSLFENQAAVDKQKIQKLQQASDEISKENIEMGRRNLELSNRNAELVENLATMMQEAAEEKSKRIAVEKHVELQKIALRDAKHKIEELKSQRTSLWDEIRELLSKSADVDSSEEDSESLSDIAGHQEEDGEELKQEETSLNAEGTSKVQELKSKKSRKTPAASEEEHYHFIPDDEHLSPQEEVLKDEEGDFGDNDAEEAPNTETKAEESSSDEEETSPRSDDTDDTPGTPDEVAEKEEPEEELRIPLGKHYCLASDRRYFDIDWTQEYETVSSSDARCKRCLSYRRKTEFVKDHIWSQHYKGKFFCPYCPDSDQQNYTWRNSLRRHMIKAHSTVDQL